MPVMQGLLKQSYTLAQFEDYLKSEVAPKMGAWRPGMIVDHNTGAMVWPGFDHHGKQITPAQRIENMSVDWVARGFSGGPHLVISPDGMINTVWPLWLPGTHSPSWNHQSWGIEHTGDFNTEQMPIAQRDTSLGAKKLLYRMLGLVANNDTYKLHLEDPKTSHKHCPGPNFGTKAWWLAKLNEHVSGAVVDTHKHLLTFSTGMKTKLKAMEGFREHAYLLKGIWHVGWGFRDGFKGLHVNATTTVSLEAANALFETAAAEMADTIQMLATVSLKQCQLDGLGLFCWNAGTNALSGSTILKKLNEGDAAGAAAAFALWNKWRPTPGAPLEVSAQLTTRRAYEADVFAGRIGFVPLAPSVTLSQPPAKPLPVVVANRPSVAVGAAPWAPKVSTPRVALAAAAVPEPLQLAPGWMASLIRWLEDMVLAAETHNSPDRAAPGHI